MCLSGCDMDFPYLASQESTWTWLAVSSVCEVSLGCSWTPLPHCHLKRPSVRFSQAGVDPPGSWLKWWAVKLKGKGGWQLAPACCTEFHLVCLETNLPALPVPRSPCSSRSHCSPHFPHSPCSPPRSPCYCKWVCSCLQARDCSMLHC